MDRELDREPRGRIDLASILYIALGVPGIVAFLVVLFVVGRACNLPA